MSETSAATPPEQTSTGEIRDQAKPATPEATSTPKPATEPAKPEAETDKSLLNQDGKPVEGKPEEAKPAVAPDKYTDFKVPEGFKLDDAVAKEAGELFKGLNLPQEGAQKLIDFYSAKTLEAAEAPYKAYRDMQTKWVDEIKADPEIGEKLDEVKTVVGRAIDGLGNPKLAASFREAMDLTGAGNNPAFIRAFYKLAQKVTEGQHVAGRGPAAVKPPGRGGSAAHNLYPNLP